SQHKIVCKTHDYHLSPGVALSPFLCPQIENVMQVDVCEQGRNDSSLRGTNFRFGPDAILRYSCSEPFLNQAQGSRVGDPMLEEFYEPPVIDGIEETTDVCIEHPVDLF